MKINVYNEYGPLKEVIIGDATKLFFQTRMKLNKKSIQQNGSNLLQSIFIQFCVAKKYQILLLKNFKMN